MNYTKRSQTGTKKGGQPGVRPFAEAALGAISDPTSLTGFGVGAFAKYKAAREGIKVALKERIKAVGEWVLLLRQQ
jgi:hypothetical protein